MAVDVSKQVGYAVLENRHAEVSKQNAYAVVETVAAQASKQTAYAVVRPSQQLRVSKENAYAVLRAVNALRVSKQTAYAVLLSPDPVQVGKQVAYAVLLTPNIVYLPLIAADVVTDGAANIRLPLIDAEAITGGNADIRLSLDAADAITGGNPTIRCPIIAVEIVYALREEGIMATAVFPTLKGLTWSVHRKPMFKTKVAEHVSGHEVRASFMEYPVWEFNLSYEFMRNTDPADDLETMMGFFLERQGKWDEWLFRDPEFYEVTEQQFAVADGGTIFWPALRKIGAFLEPIGQFDLTEQFQFGEADVNVGADTITENDHGYSTGYGPIQLTTAGTLPAGLSPLTNYWLIVVNSNTLKLATSPANAAAGTAVPITDDGTGTFIASNSIAVYDNGTQVSPSDYTVTAPNIITFDSAPTDEHVLTWSGKYYYVCRFLEDVQDFEEFMYRLYTLQECNFKSVLTIE